MELADVRILAFGTLNRPRSTLTMNHNAHIFLHPPGVDAGDIHPHHSTPRASDLVEDHGVYPVHDESWLPPYRMSIPLAVFLPDHNVSFVASYASSATYTRLVKPLPAPSHANYPYYTPGGGDKRWLGSGGVEEEGLRWVGGLM